MALCVRAVRVGTMAGVCVLTLASAGLTQQRAASVGGPGTGATPSASSVSVMAALVGSNLEVKPVALHALQLVPVAGGAPVGFRTGLDGRAIQAVPPAAYWLESVQPVSLDGHMYHWRVPVELSPGQALAVELSNANAVPDSAGAAVTLVSTTSATSAPSRQMAPEVAIYQRIRRGVVRIVAGMSTGSGFVIDSAAGLLLTNAHVVAGSTTSSVAFDSTLRVPAQIVYRDNDADVAVLRVAALYTQDRPQLSLASAPAGTGLVEPGERLFAVGYPLHQEQTLTSGIASSVREGAVISDVNINHGNSGGPLVNLAGEVVGINTFGDTPDGHDGPGVSGSILITRAESALDAARRALPGLAAPSAARLPLMPTARYSTAMLKAVADTVKLQRYAQFNDIDVNRFNLNISTPLIQYVRVRAFEQVIAKDRKKREQRSNLSGEERYSELRDYRDWREYVGDERAPVMVLDFQPQLGETGGSVFRRLMLTGAGGKATYRFKGDLRGVQVYRNGMEVEPIFGGHAPVRVYQDNQWVDLKDVADRGYYIFPVDIFAPDADGTPPSILLRIEDLKHPNERGCTFLPKVVVVNAWNDLEPFAMTVAREPFVRADLNRKPTQVDTKTLCASTETAGESATPAHPM